MTHTNFVKNAEIYGSVYHWANKLAGIYCHVVESIMGQSGPGKAGTTANYITLNQTTLLSKQVAYHKPVIPPETLGLYGN